jgi:hypothetical protein
MGMG